MPRNPLVAGAPEIRFYAGKPLVTSEGHAVGTLCVMDRTPRDLTPAQLDALHALGRQTVALLEHRLAQEHLRREIALVELLRESATAANEAAGLHEALALCIERVCERIGWPVGRAYVLERDGEAVRRVSTGVWRVPAEPGYQELRAAAGELFSAREGPLARMLASRQSLWIPNIGAEPTLARREALAVGLYAAVFVPVLVRDEVVAVLEFYYPERDEPDERLLEVMGNLGTQLGRVVERERAERALGRRLADLRAVLDATAEAICLSDLDGAVRFVNTAMEDLWRGLEITDDGSIWSRLLELAERSADPATFAEGVRSLAATPTESAGGDFELADGRSFVAYSVPVEDERRARRADLRLPRDDGRAGGGAVEGGVPRVRLPRAPDAADVGAGLHRVSAGRRFRLAGRRPGARAPRRRAQRRPSQPAHRRSAPHGPDRVAVPGPPAGGARPLDARRRVGAGGRARRGGPRRRPRARGRAGPRRGRPAAPRPAAGQPRLERGRSSRRTAAP